MGFDVYGVNPENESGEYFRNNVWWWRPLWMFVCGTCEDILSEKDVEAGHFNDGHKISKSKCNKIVKRLQELMDDGTIAEYAARYEKDRKEQSEKSNKDEDRLLTSYPFSKENVQEFIKFLKNSGGMKIW